MGTVMIVLNDLKTSVDLYEKRGAMYSIRCVLYSKCVRFLRLTCSVTSPRFAMIGEA